MFYRYKQNNSGGYYNGPYVNIIVEADDAEHADSIVQSKFDVYFNGVEDGIDCPCCGNRWLPALDFLADSTPLINGLPIENYIPKSYQKAFTNVVYYKDGTIKEF